MLALATEDVSIRVGPTLASLINITTANAVKLIVAVIALIQCRLNIVQSSLIGSILNNLLFVLGLYLFRFGFDYTGTAFGPLAMQSNTTLLIVGAIATLLPASFHYSLLESTPEENHNMLSMSHGVGGLIQIIKLDLTPFAFL
ncbi:hypothetical protein VNI00_018877 [Paramarasmius palmivorus]|uniref:Sodium/calcium exchanger membrane region domain-containing protein n=1 Tax=Paramarasmius palmivorus TaxID=297713 RepID=A0AAW0ASX0_9AGAR